MVRFFKKEIKASDIAIVLGQLALDPSRAEIILRAFPALKISSQEEQDRVLGTMVMLRLFAIDYAVTLALGKDSLEKNAILDNLYSDLKRIDVKTTEGTNFYDALKEVLLIYTVALKTPHEQGPLFNVGKEFAKLCGKEYNPSATYFGSSFFTHTVDTTSKILKQHRIII